MKHSVPIAVFYIAVAYLFGISSNVGGQLFTVVQLLEVYKFKFDLKKV